MAFKASATVVLLVALVLILVPEPHRVDAHDGGGGEETPPSPHGGGTPPSPHGGGAPPTPPGGGRGGGDWHHWRHGWGGGHDGGGRGGGWHHGWGGGHHGGGRGWGPDCGKNGAMCGDPKIIGGDGVMFYFHGRKDQHFCLVSDSDLHVNAHFIGLRPPNRFRDFTWVQALTFISNPHKLTIATRKVATWTSDVDHLELTYNGQPFQLTHSWTSPDPSHSLQITRTASANAMHLVVREKMGVELTVVPVGAEENLVHNYGMTSEDCFAHFDMQFQFWNLSTTVDGVPAGICEPCEEGSGDADHGGRRSVPELHDGGGGLSQEPVHGVADRGGVRHGQLHGVVRERRPSRWRPRRHDLPPVIDAACAWVSASSGLHFQFWFRRWIPCPMCSMVTGRVSVGTSIVSMQCRNINRPPCNWEAVLEIKQININFTPIQVLKCFHIAVIMPSAKFLFCRVR